MRGCVRRCNRRKRYEHDVSETKFLAILLGLIELSCDGFAADRSLAELVSSYRAFSPSRYAFTHTRRAVLFNTRPRSR